MAERWTSRKIEELKRLAEQYPAVEIAEKLDRSVGGVVYNAMQLRIAIPSRQMIEKRC